jgi:hypothetical protein
MKRFNRAPHCSLPHSHQYERDNRHVVVLGQAKGVKQLNPQTQTRNDRIRRYCPGIWIGRKRLDGIRL